MLTWPFRHIEELCFKPTSGGWLLVVPFAWPKRTYLVTDVQKAALSKQLRRLLIVQMVVGIAAACAVPGLLENQTSLIQWMAIAAICSVIILAGMAYTAIAIRPRLAGLSQSEARITYMDRFKRQAAIYPMAMIIALLLCSAVLFAGDLALGITQRWDLTTAIGAVLFGLTTLHAVALLIMRVRLSVRSA
jgi:hypothetical protein